MKANLLPDQKYLNVLFKYDSEQGTLHWLPQPGKRCNSVRSRAGCFSTKGYRVIRIDNCLYKEHRIIWVMNNGPIPDGFVVDHIDRNPSNNKLDNLRLVSSSVNNINKCSKGVSYDKARDKWKAQLVFEGKQVLNKRFDSYEEATEAYAKAKLNLFSDINIKLF
jgi:hypothetical protein